MWSFSLSLSSSNIKSLCAYHVLWLNHRAGPGKQQCCLTVAAQGEPRASTTQSHHPAQLCLSKSPTAKRSEIEPGLSTHRREHPACLLQSFICIATGQSAATHITQYAVSNTGSERRAEVSWGLCTITSIINFKHIIFSIKPSP